MLVVIDSCKFGEVLGCKNPTDALIYSLLGSKLKLVYGGSKYANEVKKYPQMLQYILILTKARGICVLSDEEVNECDKVLIAEGQWKSNDLHILAMLSLSNCTLLRTNDKNLKIDVKAWNSACKIIPDKPEFIKKACK